MVLHSVKPHMAMKNTQKNGEVFIAMLRLPECLP